jgi:hypothetical protein
MDYYKKYQSQEWVDIQNELEEDEKSASIMDEFRDNNNLKTNNMDRTKKTKILISLIGESIKKSEIINIINMSDNSFDYYYKSEMNIIKEINK